MLSKKGSRSISRGRLFYSQGQKKIYLFLVGLVRRGAVIVPSVKWSQLLIPIILKNNEIKPISILNFLTEWIKINYFDNLGEKISYKRLEDLASSTGLVSG